MFERLREVLVEVCGTAAEDITRDSRIGDLLRDSLDLVEFSLAVEEDGGLDLPDTVAEGLTLQVMTVGELADLLERYRRDDGQ